MLMLKQIEFVIKKGRVKERKMIFVMKRGNFK